ncbi:MAG: DNA helicase [Alphaproteobacteria bacterium]
MKLSAPIYRLKRTARQQARKQGIALNQALDALAGKEGYQSWSHLSQSWAKSHPARRLLDRLQDGQLVLLAARAGHGKTSLGLDLAIEAVLSRRTAWFFTLAYSDSEVRSVLAAQPADRAEAATKITLDCSDEISAPHMMERLGNAPAGTLVVVDYLQLLDQRRDLPALQEQLEALHHFARQHRITLIMISQVDRAFDQGDQDMPGLSDIRLPNPLDLALFDQAVFLHNGQMTLTPVQDHAVS